MRRGRNYFSSEAVFLSKSRNHFGNVARSHQPIVFHWNAYGNLKRAIMQQMTASPRQICLIRTIRTYSLRSDWRMSRRLPFKFRIIFSSLVLMLSRCWAEALNGVDLVTSLRCKSRFEFEWVILLKCHHFRYGCDVVVVLQFVKNFDNRSCYRSPNKITSLMASHPYSEVSACNVMWPQLLNRSLLHFLRVMLWRFFKRYN